MPYQGAFVGRAPHNTFPAPASWHARYAAASAQVMERALALAGGDPARVSFDMWMDALRATLPTSTSVPEDDYARRVSLAVLQQTPGSGLFYADLAGLDACLKQGRVPAAESEPSSDTFTLTTGRAAMSGASLATFTSRTLMGSRTLDMMQSTGVKWRLPRGFLARYQAASPAILRKAVELAGSDARVNGAVHVAKGAWAKVTPGVFVDAVHEVIAGGLSEEEHAYVLALAVEATPRGVSDGYVHDVTHLDQWIRTGRTPSSIKGPVLLPTVFLNDTTSGRMAHQDTAMYYTSGRIY